MQVQYLPNVRVSVASQGSQPSQRLSQHYVLARKPFEHHPADLGSHLPEGARRSRACMSTVALAAGAGMLAGSCSSKRKGRLQQDMRTSGASSQAGSAIGAVTMLAAVVPPHLLTANNAVGTAAALVLVSRLSDVRHLPRLLFDRHGSLMPKAITAASCLLIFGYEKFIGMSLLKLGLPIPSTLAAMLTLFAVLRISQSLFGKETSDKMAGVFSPGVDFLGKWMGLFLAPPLSLVDRSLAALPRYSQQVWLRTVGILGIGWGATHAVTALVAASMQPVLPEQVDEPRKKTVPRKAMPSNPIWSPANITREEQLRRAWVLIGSFSFLGAVLATKFQPGLLKPFGILCELSAVVFAFTHAKLLPKIVTKIFHPIVLTALALNVCNQFIGTWGTGAFLFGWLNAAVTGLGVRMYFASPLWLDNPRNFRAVLASCSVSGLFSLFFTALVSLSRSSPLRIPTPLSLPVLNRSVMSALGIAGAITIGPECDPKLAVASILITGCIGASFGRTLLRALRFNSKQPVVQGTAMGCSAHAIGTAGLLAAGMPEAAAIAGASMCLAGTVHTAALQTPGVVAWIRGLAGL
mmetsp:Transcript_33467/g.78228  ORF Transcript_33467/g.78228 Transcript_33467/m.78228 type:complete len:579 (-) Transcript_33467:128-1864(-)|eukprot:CAMPEP_0178413082 /NCGR_PEP_ID=MMETSP0689_2-20121128/22346_1 /TAXON_ID=160604 /ORGANISM="Amphidinium massartii, Strain CS-259" /LENGTH=578 /DNA_ID=CAMNT_0020034347 /DNA_START=55 /DNA_END=1791 /DNA_ORIENTATION=-